jgi:D-sedoheptulose 7-phosphate isomerase
MFLSYPNHVEERNLDANLVSLSSYEHRTSKPSATVASGKLITLDEALTGMVAKLKTARDEGRRVYLVGNGGSLAICTHTVSDLIRKSIRAFTFDNAALISSVSNDFGYDNVFAFPLEVLLDNNDILIAITSSGRSQSIVSACKISRSKKCDLFTFTGMQEDNPVRKLGDINIYVPENDYGYIEMLHHQICHAITDTL